MFLGLLLLSAAIFQIILCSTDAHNPTESDMPTRWRRGFAPRVDGLQVGGTLPVLRPRATLDPIFLGSEWILDHHDFTCLLPIATAAATMQSFYEDIAAFAATTLADHSDCYKLWAGEILLEIVAPKGILVPWISIQHFALLMLEKVKRGYVNTYQINYVHWPSKMLITFSLYTGMSGSLSRGQP